MKRSWMVLSVLLSVLIIVSCLVDKPSVPEGKNVLTLVALDTSGVYGDQWTPIPGAVVKINSMTFFYHESFETDEEGRVVIENLPAGEYTIMAEKFNEVENILILGQMQKEIYLEKASQDTVFMTYFKASPLVLNEVHYCGCNASQFYFYDQFIELYNSSEDTLYLDGYLMCRGTQILGIIDFEAEDYALAYYVYKFPGERGVTRLCPIAPKEFLVIAGDAIDHSYWAGALCVDHTGADWEFYNPLSSDYDNLLVPNLEPITATGVDFTYNLNHAALWFATGEEYEFQDHWDGVKMQQYCHIPLWTIIDGVEYANNSDANKYLTIRIDAGLGGNGNSRYSGRSIERRFPGLDSNNSTFDFVIIDTPTPGYQH